MVKMIWCCKTFKNDTEVALYYQYYTTLSRILERISTEQWKSASLHGGWVSTVIAFSKINQSFICCSSNEFEYRD